MSLRAFLEKSKIRYRNLGPSVIPSIIGDFVMSASSRIPTNFGTNIFDKDWDICVVLDACRHDMYCDIVNSCPSIWSVGGTSNEWIRKTLTQPEAEETIYVTANPWITKNESNCYEIRRVFDWGWDDDLGTVPPRPVTDEAIRVGRETDRQMIVHYMQPHSPFIFSDLVDGSIVAYNSGRTGRSIWDQLLFGERTDGNAVREAFMQNLHGVISDIELLLKNIDGDVVITADHGNALGEWGTWGHKEGFVHPGMRRVPWDERTGVDTESYAPPDRDETTDRDINDQLEALGYR